MIHDRPYQIEAVASIWNYFGTRAGNPVIAMPTGTGKSIVIARFLQSVLGPYPRQRVMALTHVKELIQQNYSKMLEVWPFAPAGIYSAGLNRHDAHTSIVFGGIGSVYKKWALFGHVDLVLIDEAHLLNPADATMYMSFLTGLRSINPRLKVIGFTATPWRIGQGRITDPVTDDKGTLTPAIFTDVCFDITGVESFNRLIAEGYLSPLVPKSTATKLDIDGVHMRGGDFIPSELQAAVNKQDITVSAIREAMELGHDRKHWLVFAAGVDHAIDTADVMNAMGVPTVAIHSKLTGTERDKGLRDYLSGKYVAAVNNNVLTTGFDFPGIDLILCLRPTMSAVLWVQMLGRGTRPVYAKGYDLDDVGQRLAAIEAGGKANCLVLDYANNTRRLGPINDPVVPKRRGQRGGDAPVKVCPQCHTYVHASLRWCNGVMADNSKCTYQFEFETKLKQGASTADLIKGDMPVVEVFKVDHITVSKHEKDGRPPMMRVSYYCGLRCFEEFVCAEHTNYAGRKARDWWRARSSDPMPATTAEALEAVSALRPATHLRIWVNKKYPEILAACFDGTAFGKEEASDAYDLPAVQAPRPGKSWDEQLNDDVPF